MRSYRLSDVFVLSVLSLAVAAQSNQQKQPDHSDPSRGKQVDAGFTTGGKSYHSDYFEFTYSLPDGFVEGTEEYRQGIMKQLGMTHPDADSFVLFHADRQRAPNGDPTGGITIMADNLSGYPKGATEIDYLHHFVTRLMKRNGDDLLQEGEAVHVSGRKCFRADYKTNGQPMIGYQTVTLTFLHCAIEGNVRLHGRFYAADAHCQVIEEGERTQ